LPSTVQYVCRAGLDTGADFEYDGALDVLRVIMSYDYLWANIRVLGGAYGCMCDFGRTGHVSFVSYRDPNLKETLEVYEKAADYIENFEADERTMTKYVIGAVAVLDRPFTPAAYADYSRSGYLTGRTEEEVLKNRLQVLDAKPEDIRKLSGHIRKAFENSVVCVFGSDAKIEENRGLFDSAEYIFKN
ncbi:MAG: insulinase family protein, partial [Lachnospiraceae bacterium]|nr:insulinase family protein [Lachnospiraceae bacterium]